MTNLTIGNEGQIALPGELLQRYAIAPNTSVRVIETRGGILLVPQSGASMTPELQDELAQWQSLSADAWEMFPYEDADR